MLQGFFKWTRRNKDGQIISDDPVSDRFIVELFKNLTMHNMVLPKAGVMNFYDKF
jgi:hypothetical protein